MDTLNTISKLRFIAHLDFEKFATPYAKKHGFDQLKAWDEPAIEVKERVAAPTTDNGDVKSKIWMMNFLSSNFNYYFILPRLMID